jgi:hypothetical protein
VVPIQFLFDSLSLLSFFKTILIIDVMAISPDFPRMAAPFLPSTHFHRSAIAVVIMGLIHFLATRRRDNRLRDSMNPIMVNEKSMRVSGEQVKDDSDQQI